MVGTDVLFVGRKEETPVVFKMSAIDVVVRYRINFTVQRLRVVSTVANGVIVRIDLVDDRVRQEDAPVERQGDAPVVVQGGDGPQQGAAEHNGQA